MNSPPPEAPPNGPAISVIMPVYNGAAYVAEALASVLAQANVAFEVVVRDDGSTDETLTILRRFERDDSRIQVIAGPNLGPAACRNQCLESISGAFVAFLDHDDLWPEGRLQRQMQRLLSKPETMAVLGETMMFEHLGRDGRPIESPRSRRVLAGLLQAGLFRAALFAGVCFEATLPAADDFDVMLQIVETGCRIETEHDVAVYYRLHPAQLTQDLHFTGTQTVRAIGRSLRRRRALNAYAKPLRPLELP